MLARARSGSSAPAAEVVTTKAINLPLLGAKLGCWFMVDHRGLEEGQPKTVFAACDQRQLEAILRDL
jgi:hypothetical protein